MKAAFEFDYDLIRRGGNQLGVLAMGAGLIAYFIQPVDDTDALLLMVAGVVLFALTSVKRRKPNKHQTTTKYTKGESNGTL